MMKRIRLFALVCLAAFLAAPGYANLPSDPAFQEVLKEQRSLSKAVKNYYANPEAKVLWIGQDSDSEKRLKVFSKAVSVIGNHGLNPARYPLEALKTRLEAATTDAEKIQIEFEMSELFIAFCSDLQSGIVTPARVHPDIKRKLPKRDAMAYLTAFAQSTPGAFMNSLPPKSMRYRQLYAAKRELQKVAEKGGYGPSIPEGPTMRPGAKGKRVNALIARLKVMGYFKGQTPDAYTKDVQIAVARYQLDNGMNYDGIVGPATLRMINMPIEKRMQKIVVAMERERWMNKDLGTRHIEVNIADYTAHIVEDEVPVFRTRAVVGADKEDHRSPEFSDAMEYIVFNPSWNVPYGITVKEYLPDLQKNPYAVSHLRLLDNAGNPVDRASVDFTIYDETNFPYRLQQKPSDQNALGRVKFMLPNRYNIYLHDTPAKNLFAKDMRAHSHGCVRLHDPMGFARAILGNEVEDPETLIINRLAASEENYIHLNKHIPVHIIYRTAVPNEDGSIGFRDDIYGRDMAIWKALNQEGVEIVVASR